jgi:hypothetical protein
MNVDDMAGQSVRLKEEHLRKEEEKVKSRVQIILQTV